MAFLLCPIWHLKIRKSYYKYPENFDHLYDELHSESGDDCPKTNHKTSAGGEVSGKLLLSTEVSTNVNEGIKKI